MNPRKPLATSYLDQLFFPPLNPREIEGWMRIPFVSGGRDRKGLDCWGLIYYAYKTRGIELPIYGDTSAYDLIRVHRLMDSSEELRIWHHIEGEVELPMDVVVMSGAMRTTDGALRNAPVHVGLVTKTGWLLHTEEQYGMLHVPLRGRKDITSRIKGIYRWIRQ